MNDTTEDFRARRLDEVSRLVAAKVAPHAILRRRRLWTLLEANCPQPCVKLLWLLAL